VELLLSCIYVFLGLLFISKNSFFRLAVIPDQWLYGTFLLKVFCGIVFWFVYTRYYPVRKEADIFKYFDDSKIMYDALYRHPADFFRMFSGTGNEAHLRELYYSQMQVWSPRFENMLSMENHTMIRLNVLFRFFSGGYYQVHNVLINLLSFSGLIALYKVFTLYVPSRERLLFCAVCFLPSVLFWGSGLIKESFALFASGLAIYFMHLVFIKAGWRTGGLPALAFLLLLLMIKTIIGVLVVLGLLAWYLSLRIKKWPAIWNFAGLILISFTGLILLSLFSPFNFFQQMVTKQTDQINVSNGGLYLSNGSKMIYIPYEKKDVLLKQVGDSVYRVIKGSDFYYFNRAESRDTFYIRNANDTVLYKLFSYSKPAGKVIPIPLLTGNPLSFIKNAPIAFAHTLSSPLLFEKNKGIQLPAALENMLVILLLIPCVFFFNRTLFNRPEFLFCVFLVIGYFILMGLVIPVPGALIRLKTSMLPFFMILLVILYDVRPGNICPKKPLTA
jgi:hypothetical protein